MLHFVLQLAFHDDLFDQPHHLLGLQQSNMYVHMLAIENYESLKAVMLDLMNQIVIISSPNRFQELKLRLLIAKRSVRASLAL